MKAIHLLGFLLALSLPIHLAKAIPNSFFGNGPFFGPIIPAHPVFKANLTEDFFELSNWEKGEFPGPWKQDTSFQDQKISTMTANPTLFGHIPMAVHAYGSDETPVQEMAIHFLDAGRYFGYLAGGEKTNQQKRSGDKKRSDFNTLYLKISRDLRKRLETGCGAGKLGSIGKSDELRTVYTEHSWEGFRIRYVARPEHSISLYLSKKDHPLPSTYLDPTLRKMKSGDKDQFFSKRVIKTDIGDQLINSLPMYTQGNTPFCGIHSLAMTGRYLGLKAQPESLAAGAEFRNTGSAKGSSMVELYKAVGEELDMKLSISSKFDLRRVQRSIDAGIPVIVWRRVSYDREKAHNEFLGKWQNNPQLKISEPTAETKKTYPPRAKKGTPSHASVVTGVNLDRNEVIFTEPWGELSRNRRMRVEEMEATTYTSFYFKF